MLARVIAPVLTVGLLAACTGASSEPASTTRSPDPSSLPSVVGTAPPELEALDFDDFVEESFRALLARDPEQLTALGISSDFGMRNDRLNDYSEAFIAETEALEVAILGQLRDFDPSGLSGEQELTYEIYEWYLDQQVRGHEFRYHDWPVHYFVNAYNTGLMNFFQEVHPMETLADAEDYVSRVEQIPIQVSQVIEGLEARESLGVLPPRGIVDWTIGSLAGDLNGASRPDLVDPETLPLYVAFRERLTGIEGVSPSVEQDLLARALQAVEVAFVPAWITLRDHMVGLRDRAPIEAGVWRLPDGAAYYSHLLREHTSTELTASEIHDLGLAQVERVLAELRQAFDVLGFPGEASVPDLIARSYGDAGFIDGTSQSGRARLLDMNSGLIADAEGAMRPLFGAWPEASVEVIPDERGGGFYISASLDGSRPGLFHAGAGPRVALLTLPTINYHEAVPGHHTQIALAQELDLPTVRRVIQHNAFAEGWALYAELLAHEAGLYADDPYGNIGRLELELLRAVRLVVDTGIHHKAWSQDEAHAYMDQVIPAWTHEVERYMVLPGQATGYMVGQQEILRLRKDVEEALADDYDIATFHTAVLESGSVPLVLLDKVVHEALEVPSG